MTDPQVCTSCGENLSENSGFCARCLGETMDQPLLTAIPFIAAFKIIRLLGQGGMGCVYLAQDTTENRQVAIKVMSQILAQDSIGRNRFIREARSMASVQHQNIARFYSVGEFSGQPYLVMEYVEGETLAEQLKRNGAKSFQQSLTILRQTIEALNAAWKQRIVHRDIKPSNILLDKKGKLKVVDFGLAKPSSIEGDLSLTQTGNIIGSPHYISPEQAQGKKTDFRSDIYSLGIVLYEMLVGERPFDDTTPLAIVIKHLNTPVPSPRQKNPLIPETIVRLLHWMTRKDPAKRPESYDELLERVDSLLAGKVSEALFSRKVKLALSLAILIVASAVSFWLYQSRPDIKPVPGEILHTKTSVPAVIDATTVVKINALPWARVKISPLQSELKNLSVLEKEIITPCNLLLPEGEFLIELQNDSSSQAFQKKIKVEAGKVNSFSFNMPAYDPRQALAKLRGKR